MSPTPSPEPERASASPRRRATDVRPLRWARWIRRGTAGIGVVAVVWFVLKFDTRWVPAGMETLPEMPPGTWHVVDTWASGLRVGSDVWIDTPHGELLSRVVGLTADEVRIEHPNALSGWGDSRAFGALPRGAVRGVVVVSFAPAADGERGGR